MIYLASPYSAAPQENFELVRRVVWENIMLRNAVWFSPIVYMHEMALHFGGPKEWEPYASFNHNMLKASDRLLILASEGWNTSAGIQKEWEWAQNLSLSYAFIDEAGRLTTPKERALWLK